MDEATNEGADDRGTEDTTTNTGGESEGQEDSGTTGTDSTESVEETVRRSIEELSEKGADKDDEPEEASDEDEKQEEETPQELPLAAKAEGKPEKPKKEGKKGRIDPPSDWSASGKEWFKKQPREVQKEYKAVSDKLERWKKPFINELNQKDAQLSSALKEVDGVRTVVQRFLPRWGVQGLTPEQAITQMCSFNELCYQDAPAALRNLANTLGVKIQIEGDEKNNKKDVDPHLKSVIRDVQDIKERFTRSEQEQIQALRQDLANGLDNALEELKEETTQDDYYKYPKLHDEDFVAAEVEPLVRAALAANPSKDPKVVIRQCYIAAGGRVIPTSSTKTTKLNGVSDAARRASASVPGGGSGSQSVELEYIPDESVEQTVRRAVAAHRTR